MRSIIPGGLLVGLFLGQAVEAADARPKVNFQDQVSTIFRNRCNSCHNADKQKGGLNLETFGTAMQGGGSGKVIEPGDLDTSTLFQLVSHKDEPKMPPNSAKIPDAEIEVIKLWIEGGALESSGSTALAKARPKFEFKLDADAAGKPAGPPAMPEGLSTEPAVTSARPNAVVAMAASPWAPLVAVGGHKQVLLYQTTNNHLAGVLPFPEGTIHVLKFSRSGALLLAGGGRGGQSGLAVAWDVKTGKRVFEIGKEYDAVLAADISPDHGQVALGGPSKILRVYNTADGQLLFESKKHTEWITAVEFSPDGVLLASGDRNNGLLVWEAQTGREFFDLRGHTAAITDLSWRPDSNVLASSSEDGSVRLWEMENGNQIKSIGAHGGGTASVRFARDGRLVTTGRDRVARLWDPNGNKQRDFEPFADLALEAVFTHDGAAVIAGDWSGEVRVFELKEGKRLANLPANPAPLSARFDQTRQALAAAESALQALGPVQAAPAEKLAALARAQATFDDAQQLAHQQTGAADAADHAQVASAAIDAVAAELARAAQGIADRAIAEKGKAEQSLVPKAAAEKSAAEALTAARAAVKKARAEKEAQDRAVAAAQAARRAANAPPAIAQADAEVARQTKRAGELAGALAAAGNQQDAAQAAARKAAAEHAEARRAVEVASARLQAAAAALQPALVAARKAAAEKADADKNLADARASAQAAVTASAARKSELDQAGAARSAADKALADHKPAIEAARAKVQALKAELDLLAVEKKASDAAKSAMLAPPPAGS
ncbi:MAG TPA: c-type cytochrome domain-containing protein [Isosphaeraceae bacterium]|nr:c-type cytochrome domain-containing protein [Isosphaeraceae bacterium]